MRTQAVRPNLTTDMSCRHINYTVAFLMTAVKTRHSTRVPKTLQTLTILTKMMVRLATDAGAGHWRGGSNRSRVCSPRCFQKEIEEKTSKLVSIKALFNK